jgi:DNA polymerase I-like protein with 3'-5' exonuclease and polymerase domains
MTNGDIIKHALVSTYRIIKEEEWPVKILLSVYDEIQTECREDRAQEWKHRLDTIMLDSAKVVIKSVPVVVDCSVNTHWSK